MSKELTVKFVQIEYCTIRELLVNLWNSILLNSAFNIIIIPLYQMIASNDAVKATVLIKVPQVYIFLVVGFGRRLSMLL